MKKIALAVAIALSTAACVDVPHNSKPIVTSQVEAESEKFIALVEAYFDEGIAYYPIAGTYVGQPQYNDQWTPALNEANRAKYTAFVKRYLAKLEAIDVSLLQGQDLLSFEVFKRDLELAVEGTQFPSYLIPIDQMAGEHNLFAGFGSGQNVQPFNTVSDFNDFERRTHSFVTWLQSVEKSMKQGIDEGVVLPRVLAEKLLPQFASHVVDDHTKSIFWSPVEAMPSSIPTADQTKIKEQYKALILNTIVPAYQRMAQFIENEYIPAARSSFGYGELPNGKAWYEYRIKVHTTLDLNADEIHEIGLQEVARILSEMEKVKEEVKFDGSLADFFVHLRESDEFYYETPEALIKAYEDVKTNIDSRLPKLFNIAPKADYVVRAVESYRAQSAAGASYQGPAPDGSRPGIFYINTFNLKAQPKFLLETLSIHEASPGHHFQTALQQEVEGLPRFRRFGNYTVYEEGWALYAESLGKELGLFTDPYMWYGRLVDEQLRAMRLVLDTGFHAKGWTREQGIEYMKANSSMAESDIVSEVERYIGWPGQALSYKLGEFTIRELRETAQKELGDKFDVKEFHTQILIDGSLPMPILEKKILRWVEQVKKS